MFSLKKTAVTLCVCALLLTSLSSCGGPELLDIFPTYIGPDVTSTTHEFTTKDFLVVAAYDDSTDKIVTDYEIVVEGMEQGYYILTIKYDGRENQCFVPIKVPVYPSDKK